MRTEKIASKHFDSLREEIISVCDGEIEVLVYGRRDGNITVDLSSGHSLSGEASKAIADAISHHFEGQSERVRLRTQFSLVAYRDVAGIFLEYKMEDFLLELERATLEVPAQIMRIVQFLEEEPEATVEFRFGHYPDNPFEFVEFVLSQNVEMAGCNIIAKCSQNAKPSFGFIKRVAGEYLEHIINNPPIMYGSQYTVYFVLEEENEVVYFRMKYKGRRFYSIEKDKLRSKNENS